MRAHIFTRRKKYLQVLTVMLVLYSVWSFTVSYQTTIVLKLREFQNRTSITVSNLKSTAITVSNLKSVKEVTKEVTMHLVSNETTTNNVHSLEINDTIVYSEDEVQIRLKEIHEQGERTIGLKHDECKQRLPECLIIGNFKCGTQELLEFMFMHPRIRIYREPFYELHFFAENYHKGYYWYRKQMPCSYSGQITVEKSPDYFQYPYAPTRMHKMNPNMKLIALVRDPIERALSHFSFLKDDAKRYGYQLERCALYSGRFGVNRNCFAIKHSIYNEGIKRYLQIFNRSQILIINNDDFKNDPFRVLYDIEAFLGFEHVIDRKNFVYIEDKGFYCVRSVRNTTLVACYDQRRGRKTGSTDSLQTINKTALAKLKTFFKPLNDLFFQEIGRTFNWQSNVS